MPSPLAAGARMTMESIGWPRPSNRAVRSFLLPCMEVSATGSAISITIARLPPTSFILSVMGTSPGAPNCRSRLLAGCCEEAEGKTADARAGVEGVEDVSADRDCDPTSTSGDSAAKASCGAAIAAGRSKDPALPFELSVASPGLSRAAGSTAPCETTSILGDGPPLADPKPFVAACPRDAV